ncbi:protein BTG2 [Nephila pilipes]|uniref:Protein BTG2 n=1 Tax=Nephila pilipes TaxID=299642 RepID=A0A8X6IS43_NEPPI|nr:protein BTG2 [Nephila pilipes]
MKVEIGIASDFLTGMMRNKCPNPNKVEHFKNNLVNLLKDHFEQHWFPGSPTRGSAYRCIRIHHSRMDPLVLKAAHACGFNERIIQESLPKDLTLWIDPCNVSYRFGENGSVAVLYEIPNLNEDTYNGASTPKRSMSMKIRKLQPLLNNVSDDSSSDDSGCISPMSMSPPSPKLCRVNSCKGSLQDASFNMDHNGFGISTYVAS